MLLSPPAINGSCIHTVCEFREQHLLGCIYWDSIYWVAFIGLHLLGCIYWVAFIANTSTTLIADASYNCKLCPIIAESNNWTLQALAATCVMGVRFVRGVMGCPSEVGGVGSWEPSVGMGYQV